MPKYIDVGAINWYDDLFMKGVNNSGVWVRYKDVESLIRNAPAADVKPVRHGRWIQLTEECGWSELDCAECSECGEDYILDEWGYEDFSKFMNYCPNCGAKMLPEPPKEEEA